MKRCVAVAVALSCVLACDCGSVSLRDVPRGVASEASLDFGEVEVGDVATLALSMSNEGGGLLTGTVLVEGGDGDFTASASEFERSSGTSERSRSLFDRRRWASARRVSFSG
jgi:hypothetical protein